jgi:hypothetical protein
MKSTVLSLLTLVLLLAGCQGPSVYPVYFTGEFSVQGTATHTNILAQSFNGTGTAQYYNIPLPWSYEYAYAQSGQSFYLAAQSNDPAGDLTVTVSIDGAPLITDTTSDPFGFVAVYGTVP